MQTTDIIPSLGLDPVQNNWSFLEVWVDPMQSPPYVLMLLGDRSGSCNVLDPNDSYRVIKNCSNYREAQLWLLEDEYEPLEGRLAGIDIH